MKEHESTANKLRPQKFNDLVGQEFIVSSLLGSIKSDSIAGNAFILSGPRGVGKTSAARLIALAVNRPEGQDINSLDYEGSDEIRKGNSLDVIEIDGASYTSVENVRKIREEVMYAPSQFRYKVYIIDEVHMLSNSAFNALLKTIEEPPEYVIFVFATTEIDKVPLTIRSRCQRFAFHLIPNTIIMDKLQELCNAINTTIESAALEWMAKEARGSLRDAYTLFDQIHAFCGNNITKEAIDTNLGLTGIQSLNVLFQLCVNGKYRETQEHIFDLLTRGCTTEKILFEACEYIRNVLLIKHSIEPKLLIGFDKEQFDATIYETLSTEQLEHALQLLLDCYRSLRYSVDPQFEVELVFHQLCNIKNYTNNNMLVQQLKELYTKLQFQTHGNIPDHDVSHETAPAPTVDSAIYPDIINPTVEQQHASASKHDTSTHTSHVHDTSTEQQSQPHRATAQKSSAETQASPPITKKSSPVERVLEIFEGSEVIEENNKNMDRNNE